MPFFAVVFPVFLTALIGFIYARLAKPDLQPITRVTLYVLIPALVFTSMVETDLSGREIWQIAAFSGLLTGTLWLVGLLVVRVLQMPQERASAVLLASVFMNTANYGLPVVLYALGEAGFARAVVFVITQSFLVNSLGVYLAAAGRLDPRQALLAVVKLPTLHAAALALVVRWLPITLPQTVLAPLSALGRAGITIMLLVLGMQLARVRLVGVLTDIAVASVVRLVVSPALGLALVNLLGMGPVAGKAMILEAAMPTAVITILLALEFGAAPAVVSSAVLVTTLFSFGSVSFILYLLR